MKKVGRVKVVLTGGVEHWEDAHEDSVVIEVFSPVREDYLPR